MRPLATRVFGLKLLVYAALSYCCVRPYATSVCGLKLLVYGALSDLGEWSLDILVFRRTVAHTDGARNLKGLTLEVAG